MTSKELIHAAIKGREQERFPVMAPYLMLSNADHWVELTGLPVWRFYEWTFMEPDKHAEMYKVFYEKLPFDVVQPWYAPSREQRENTEIVFINEVPFFHYKKEEKYERIPSSIHESSSCSGENGPRTIFDKADAREKIKIQKAEQLIGEGCNDYLEGLIRLYGDAKFVINGGVTNTFYSNCYYLGMENFFTMLKEEPELIKYMSGLLLEKNIETIRAYAAAGGDAIYIDDATATCDMVSPNIYEEFSLPYLTQQVNEIRSLGKKAIVIYFGGIEDRVDLIAASGADVLSMETSMKSYRNDLEEVMMKMGGRMCIAGNLNPYDDIEITDDEELERRVIQQLRLGKKYRKFISSTGSPLTPGTSVDRIFRFIDLVRTSRL